MIDFPADFADDEQPGFYNASTLRKQKLTAAALEVIFLSNVSARN